MSDRDIPSSEKLVKNLHPDDFDGDRINSSAFNPSKSHDFQLSTDRLSISSAQDCFNKFVSKGYKSIGVCGVLNSDFNHESINCLPDPIEDNEAHTLADFRPHGVNQRKKKARRLADKALKYGLDFSPDKPASS